MKAGQTLVASDGHEVALFPTYFMNFTQIGPSGTYSHCCGHAMDIADRITKFPIYAPFSCHRVGTIASEHGYIYVSDDDVWTPTGLKTLSFDIMHDDVFPIVQNSFSQGELIGHSGTSGTATGDHSHIEFAEGLQTVIDFVQTCTGGGNCYALRAAIAPELAVFINDTDIINDYGLDWKTWDGAIQFDIKKFLILISKQREEKGGNNYRGIL